MLRPVEQSLVVPHLVMLHPWVVLRTGVVLKTRRSFLCGALSLQVTVVFVCGCIHTYVV